MLAVRRDVLLALAAGLVLAGCGEDGEAPLAPDLTPPAVIAVSPAAGTAGVRATIDTVWVEFDEPVVVPDLASALVVRSPGVLLPGAVALDSTATILSFIPSVPFAASTDFTATLAAGIADRGGNARADSLVTRFTTALAFQDIGRIFCANAGSNNLTVLDVLTYEEVAGSPLRLGVSPRRLRAERGEGVIYALYVAPLNAGAGILVVDGRSLAVLGDSGPILPADAADLAVSPEHGLVFAVSPGSAALHVLDASTLAAAHAPLRFDRSDARPARVEVARRLGYVLVALDGGARLAAFRLPALAPLAGFPAQGAANAHTVLVDEERARAWVGGSQRYAVVDLINPGRTTSLQMPAGGGTGRLWSMIHDPVHDRIFFIDRFNFVYSVRASDLGPAPESPSPNLFRIFGDLVQDPRTANLVVLGWRHLSTYTWLVNYRTLARIDRNMPDMGDNAVDLEMLP